MKEGGNAWLKAPVFNRPEESHPNFLILFSFRKKYKAIFLPKKIVHIHFRSYFKPLQKLFYSIIFCPLTISKLLC